MADHCVTVRVTMRGMYARKGVRKVSRERMSVHPQILTSF
jgi:hypothetical protein